MVQVGTKIKIVDNSGAKWVKCIKVLGKGNRKYATTGNIILITINKFSNRKKVKKRVIYLGLIVAVVFWTTRLDGSFIKFFSNRLLVFNKQYKFLGTRVYGLVLKEIAKLPRITKKERKNFQKVLSYNSISI